VCEVFNLTSPDDFKLWFKDRHLEDEETLYDQRVICEE